VLYDGVNRSNDPDSYYSDLAEINTGFPQLAKQVAIVRCRLRTVEILRWWQHRHGTSHDETIALTDIDHSWKARLLVNMELVVVGVLKLLTDCDGDQLAYDDVIEQMVSREARDHN